jgi:hypothetical protein
MKSSTNCLKESLEPSAKASENRVEENKEKLSKPNMPTRGKFICSEGRTPQGPMYVVVP